MLNIIGTIAMIGIAGFGIAFYAGICASILKDMKHHKPAA